MQKGKKNNGNDEENSSISNEQQENIEAGSSEDKESIPENKKESISAEEFEAIKSRLSDIEKQNDEYLNMLKRSAAEFDNYKKRTVREKEALYTDAVSDVVSAFLPVMDNLDRAIQACSSGNEGQSLKEGVELVARQLKDIFKNLGIEEMKCVGSEFDPQLHNAVMHIEDDSYSKNVVVEEFQKGYMFKEKVIRHSMVKVAN